MRVRVVRSVLMVMRLRHGQRSLAGEGRQMGGRAETRARLEIHFETDRVLLVQRRRRRSDQVAVAVAFDARLPDEQAAAFRAHGGEQRGRRRIGRSGRHRHGDGRTGDDGRRCGGGGVRDRGGAGRLWWRWWGCDEAGHCEVARENTMR